MASYPIDQALGDAVSRGLSIARGAVASALGPAAGLFNMTQRAVRDTYMTTRSVVALASDPSTLVPAAISAATGVSSLRYPSEIGKYYVTLSFSSYQRPSLFDPVTLTTTDTIVLPVPANLQDSHKVNYSDGDLGPVLGTAAESGAGAVSALGAVSIDSLLGITPAQAQQVLSGAGHAIDAIEQAVKGALLNNTGDLGRLAGQIAGQTGNPFLTVFFRGPTLRTHEFSWRLSPRSADESRTLKDIVLTIKRHALAKRVGDGILLGYPDIVTVRLHPNEEFLYTFKQCVVEQVSVNYAPSGVPSFYAGTGAPTDVELRVVLQEIEYFLATDFGDHALEPSNVVTGLATDAWDALQGSGGDSIVASTTHTSTGLGRLIDQQGR